MAYATPSQLIQFIDQRLILDLISDNNIRATIGQLLHDTDVTLSLSTASGLINSAALTSQRYTVGELTGLTGDDQNLLTMMTCWLAFGILAQRRGRDPEQQPAYKQVQELMTMLKHGESVFNVAADVGSGVSKTAFMSTVQWQTVNTLRSATYRYYPTRRIQNTTY